MKISPISTLTLTQLCDFWVVMNIINGIARGGSHVYILAIPSLAPEEWMLWQRSTYESGMCWICIVGEKIKNSVVKGFLTFLTAWSVILSHALLCHPNSSVIVLAFVKSEGKKKKVVIKVKKNSENGKSESDDERTSLVSDFWWLLP